MAMRKPGYWLVVTGCSTNDLNQTQYFN